MSQIVQHQLQVHEVIQVHYVCCVNNSRRQMIINFPNSDLRLTSHCNIKGLSVSEVMKIENVIIQVQFYWYLNSFSPLLLYEWRETQKKNL